MPASGVGAGPGSGAPASSDEGGSTPSLSASLPPLFVPRVPASDVVFVGAVPRIGRPVGRSFGISGAELHAATARTAPIPRRVMRMPERLQLPSRALDQG